MRQEKFPVFFQRIFLKSQPILAHFFNVLVSMEYQRLQRKTLFYLAIYYFLFTIYYSLFTIHRKVLIIFFI